MNDRWRYFLKGFCSAFDLFPAPASLPKQTDAEALASDWQAVGDDFRKVAVRYSVMHGLKCPVCDGTGIESADAITPTGARGKVFRSCKWCRKQKEPPLALTDQHVSALEKAIRAEGFDIFADPETGDIKLERVK